MRRPDRLGLVHGVLIIFALALVFKAGYEQLYRGSYWAAQGQRQHYTESDIPSLRGQILDERGDTLVESRIMVKIDVAPHEVRNRDKLGRTLRNLKVDPKLVNAATNPKRKWVQIPTQFLMQDAAPLMSMSGVYPKLVVDRVYANSAGIRRIVGKIDPRTGDPLDGVEYMLNDILRGDTAKTRVAKDHAGHKMERPSESSGGEPGSSVVLTINRGLQDITERAISDAVDSLGASGGDIVVLNPNTGEILAMASKRTEAGAGANTAITEPYEPGSTLKPFFAAELLMRKLAKPEDVIATYNGKFELDGRVITDVHKEAQMTLFDVIKHSSNIGIVRFTQRMNARDKFETLRNYGFGVSTSIPLPAESPGLLREPVRWSKQSPASIVMGYEIAVTPLQLAVAYAAFANSGELLEPHLVKEIRGPDGSRRYTAKRRVIRRVMSPEVASSVQQMLKDVVEGGTATRAGLKTIDLAGKSGTARRTSDGKYVEGSYTASFVGLFPSDKPQYVIVAKVDNPSGGYYGGTVAGSVTNVVLRAALAARDASLDWQTLASAVHDPKPDTTPEGRRIARAKVVADSIRLAEQEARAKEQPVAAPAEQDPRTNALYTVKLPAVKRIAPVAATVRPVPTITGLPLRAAVRALHTVGFRVEIVGGPGELTTIPAAGTMWMPGRVIKLSGGH